MNVGSLFAGIGGFDLGLQRAGFRIAWQVELDPFCRSVLAKRFPEARRFADVREVGQGDLPAVDLICGGFPCQDLSVAGRGAGIDGANSGLWGEYARIVREVRPRYLVVENVPALLTGKGKRWDRAPIGRVLGDLAALGYDAEWACLSAREFGAPHLRKRVWIVAYPEGHDEPDEPTVDDPARPLGSARPRAGCRDQRRIYSSRGRPAGGDPVSCSKVALADADGERRPEVVRLGTRQQKSSGNALGGGAVAGRRGGLPHPWTVEPRVGRVAHGVPDRVERLAALGNALVPPIAEWIGMRIAEYEARTVSGAVRSIGGGEQ